MAAPAAAPSALPYVAWSSATTALIPFDSWEFVFASMQTLKGHVQEYPGSQRFEAWIEDTPDGMRVECYTTWDTPEQLDAFLERGYTFERMLADVADLPVERTRLMEKVF
jgi:hypothetical protein